MKNFTFWKIKKHNEIRCIIEDCIGYYETNNIAVEKILKIMIKLKKQNEKANGLLRRFYNIIEMNHLNDHKLITKYCDSFDVTRQLGEDVFNYLQSKDEIFREIVIKRQKKYRKKIKNRGREN